VAGDVKDMGGRFQGRGAWCTLSVAALSLAMAGPAPAQQAEPKPKPGATGTSPPPPVLILPSPRQTDRTAPPVVVPGVRPPPGPPPPPPNRWFITNPSWARQPQPEYPAAAIANGVTEARVTLRCLAHPNGALSGCEVIEETPAGHGFAASVIAAANRARMSPRTVDGVVQGARVQFTTRFVAPPPVEPAPTP
jgi:protein TonB